MITFFYNSIRVTDLISGKFRTRRGDPDIDVDMNTGMDINHIHVCLVLIGVHKYWANG